MPALLIDFALQAVCALAAALGVWRGQRWAAGAVVLLGVSIAGTRLFEGFILGIVAWRIGDRSRRQADDCKETWY